MRPDASPCVPASPSLEFEDASDGTSGTTAGTGAADQPSPVSMLGQDPPLDRTGIVSQLTQERSVR
jgi:hypothetical protein